MSLSRRFISGWAVLLSSGVLLAPFALGQSLVVGKGEHYVISEAERDLRLEELILDDGARISFASGVGYWSVEATRGRIGKDVLIDARGEAGHEGANAPDFETAATHCGEPQPGRVGGVGASGADGVDLSLRIGVESIGNLKILSNGGDGGAGGNGGRGQDSDPGSGCDSTAGAKGGDGGAGGDGGHGGEIRVALWNAGEGKELVIKKIIASESNPGRGGKGGTGAKGGEGSGGKYVNRRSLAGNMRWEGGGEQGEAGSTGPQGQDGARGRIDIDWIAAPATFESPSANTQYKTDTTLEQTVRQLQQQIEALERRVETLESAP